MSIADIKPQQLPVDLRVKIEHVMDRERLSWRDTIIFLASEVVSPSRSKTALSVFSCPLGETTRRARRTRDRKPNRKAVAV